MIKNTSHLQRPAVHRLSCPAPRREWYRTNSGGWASRPWTPEGIAELYAGGGWLPADAEKAGKA